MERPRYDLTASGRRMRQIRSLRHISAKQVMEYMGFASEQAVYKWERGECFPQADNLLALARLYQVSPYELIITKEDSEESSFAWNCLRIRSGVSILHLTAGFIQHLVQCLLRFLLQHIRDLLIGLFTELLNSIRQRTF